MIYQLLEVVFLLWLLLPQYSGALLLHALCLDKAYSFVDGLILSKIPMKYSTP